MHRWLPCPSCGSERTRVFYAVLDVPVNSVLLLGSRTEAVAFPRGDIELAFCEACGFVFNAAFDPELVEYSDRYEETQGYSPTFRKWHEMLARDFVDRYELRGKTIVEVGCGKGEFLTMLCERGGNRGIGFDPAWVPGRNRSSELEGVSFVRDFYSERYAHITGDLLCCKMTLEHVPRTRAFVETIRRSVGDHRDTIVVFQVPDVLRILREGAFWDVYYEHCSYFSAGSLANLFRRCGFDVSRVEREYDDQYLLLEARAGDGADPGDGRDVEALSKLVDRFSADIGRTRERWRERVDAYRASGRRVVVWGSGSKGVAFLTTLGLGDTVDAVVDINPHRQGCFMAGTGHPIVAPAELRERRPDVVIAMNPVYREEIGAELHRQGLDPEVITP